MGYSRKKQNTGGEGESRGWGYEISRGIEEMTSEIPLRLIKNNVEFPVVIKKKSCGISKSLCFMS